jgi:hypothetical protein
MMFFHLKRGDDIISCTIYVERMSFHINGEGWLPVFQRYFMAFLLDMRMKIVFPDTTVDMKRVVFYMVMIVFLVFGESFLFLTHDKNLPEKWTGLSSRDLERIFFRIFGEG